MVIFAFVEPAADFDPSAFKLPTELQASQGPPAAPPPAEPAVQQLQAQLARESARAPGTASPDVNRNLQQQMQLQLSDLRANQLKPLLLAIKALPADDPHAERREALMRALAELQACYGGAQTPKDLATMQVLHPLLKCQALKWDQLRAGGPAQPPAPEKDLLQKLRLLKGSLGAVEKAALFQLILALNAQLELLQPSDSPPETAQPAAAPPVAPKSTPAASITGDTSSGTCTAPPTDFDPLAANRSILQLRARLQRGGSAAEQQSLRGELQTLLDAQQAYFQQRQAQAISRQTQDWLSDGKRFEQPERLNPGSFAQWRKLRLTGLQSLHRLYSQPADSVAQAHLESAQRQLARLGLPEAGETNAQERRQLPPVVETNLQAWLTAFNATLALAESALTHLAQHGQQAELRQRLEALNQTRSDWQARQQKLQRLEAEYLAAEPQARQALKLRVLEAYAELLAQLPPAETPGN